MGVARWRGGQVGVAERWDQIRVCQDGGRAEERGQDAASEKGAATWRWSRCGEQR